MTPSSSSGGAHLRVNATELSRQPGTRRRVETSASLAELGVVEPRLSGEVDVDLTLESTIDDVVVNGTATVAWADECRRCLRPLAEPLRVQVTERYAETPGPHTHDRGHGLDDAAPIEHGQIDLAPLLREELLLAVPDAPLCRDDCPGLCPTCGVDRQTGSCDCDTDVRDERWAVLDQLRDQ